MVTFKGNMHTRDENEHIQKENVGWNCTNENGSEMRNFTVKSTMETTTCKSTFYTLNKMQKDNSKELKWSYWSKAAEESSCVKQLMQTMTKKWTGIKTKSKKMD